MLPELSTIPCKVSLNATSLWHHCLLVVNMVFTKYDKVAMEFLRENKHYGAKNFPQCNGRWVDWTEFWREPTRQVLSNERNVPVDRGRCSATTTSNSLSSWHLVCARVSRRKADTLNTDLNRGYMCNYCIQFVACNLSHAIHCMQLYSARRPSDAKINCMQQMQQIACNYFKFWAGLSLSISVWLVTSYPKCRLTKS